MALHEISDFEESGTPDPAPLTEGAADAKGTDGREAPDLPARNGQVDVSDARVDDTGPPIDRPRDTDTGQFVKGRHRAKSQRASADDAPRIQELNTRLRETQVQLAITRGLTDIDAILGEVYPEASDDQKHENRAKIEKLVAKYAPKKAPAKPTLPPTVETTEVPGFTDPEPNVHDYDDIGTFLKDHAAWDRKRYDAEQQAAAAKAKQADGEKAKQEWEAKTRAAWAARLTTFKQTQPEFDQQLAQSDPQITAVTHLAILLDENGPACLWFLSKHPDVADDLYFQTAHLDASDQNVALVQRRLSKLMAAESTEAAPSSVTRQPVPKPPTSVRTGPMKTGSEPPGDDATLEEHIKAFPIKRPGQRR